MYNNCSAGFTNKFRNNGIIVGPCKGDEGIVTSITKQL